MSLRTQRRPSLAALATLVAACGGNGGNDTTNTGADTTPPGADDGGTTTSATTTTTPIPSSCEGAVRVPGGTLTMGCLYGMSPACGEDELPSHEVELAGFRIDQCEVSVAEYRDCVADGACTQTPEVPYCNEFSGRDRHPINCVTWDQARDYCAYAGGALPTEAQWEYAARGTGRRTFPWGDVATGFCQRAVLLGCDTGGTLPVGILPAGASAHGVLDMAGNVAEWVGDWYGPEYYASSPAADPTGPSTGDQRVVRGGSYLSDLVEARVHTRRANAPDERVWFSHGVRCVYPDDGGGSGTGSGTATESTSTTETSTDDTGSMSSSGSVTSSGTPTSSASMTTP